MNNFRRCREGAGLSQKEAAITLGVKPPSMSAWESGKNFPTIDNLIAMASLYHVTLEMLLGIDVREEKGSQDSEARLLACFRRLNEEGRNRLISQAEDMAALPKYTQESAESVG